MTPFYSSVTCLALFAITSIQSYVPFTVPSYNEQCEERGFHGACQVKDLPWNSPLLCEQLVCARRVDGDQYIAVFTDPALEGSRCKDNGVCRNRVCTEVPPAELPENCCIENYITCEVNI